MTAKPESFKTNRERRLEHILRAFVALDTGDEPYWWNVVRSAMIVDAKDELNAAAQVAEDEEPYFILNGYHKHWRSFSHFAGKVVSYGDVVEWSGIDSDRDVIRERVYTVTYARPHGSERRDGSLAPGESVDFESGMVFNVTRTSQG